LEESRWGTLKIPNGLDVNFGGWKVLRSWIGEEYGGAGHSKKRRLFFKVWG